MIYEPIPEYTLSEIQDKLFIEDLDDFTLTYLFSAAYNLEIDEVAELFLLILRGENKDLQFLLLQVIEAFYQVRQTNIKAEEFISELKKLRHKTKNIALVNEVIESVIESKFINNGKPDIYNFVESNSEILN